MNRILCVDDNDNNLYLLSTLLDRAGYEVLVARTGEEAVTLAVAEKPDMVLMDLTLPGIDGCEATRQIRAEAGMGDIPIIALSGHDEEEKGAAARAAGCTGYTRKPIQIRVLLKMITGLLSSCVPAPCFAAGEGASHE